MKLGEAISERQTKRLSARTIVLKLRYGDFTTVTRQNTLRAPTIAVEEIFSNARELLAVHWDKRRAVRLIGVGAHNLVAKNAAWQLELLTDSQP